MKSFLRPQVLIGPLVAAALALAGCQSTGGTRVSPEEASPVSQPVPLPSGPPILVSELPPEISAPITPPSNAPLPPEGDVLSSGQVLDRLRARLSTPTCIVGPNNTRWRHKYAGYPDHFADEVQATLPMMLVVLDEVEKRKLPGEFALIPIVESWYRTDARSFGAAGMWQIIAETARNNGATVIGGYDGRLSVLDSTQAALTYLGKLHGMFNDWRLTAMAYNSGEYRVMRTMPADELQARSAGHVDYRRPEGLSTTTYEYVAKLRALTCLLAEPERQSIPLDRNATVVHWVPYVVPADVNSLDELARRLAMDADDLKTYNHGYRNGRIVAGAPRTVLVPASTKPRWTNLSDQTPTAAESINAFAGAPPNPAAGAAAAAAAESDKPGDASIHVSRTHTVARGETLFSIARHYSIGVDELRRWNHLGRHSRARAGMKLKLAP